MQDLQIYKSPEVFLQGISFLLETRPNLYVREGEKAIHSHAASIVISTPFHGSIEVVYQAIR